MKFRLELSGDKSLSKPIKKMDKLKVHIEKGCLENISPKTGTSRQESMHKALLVFWLSIFSQAKYFFK